MTKQHILDELKRVAKRMGGVAPGRLRFQTETGIKESDWRGRYWIRWNEAVKEAGLTPNQKTEGYDDDLLVAKLISFARELGHFPLVAELLMKARTEKGFPSESTFRNNLGTK